ncbi:MAG TPA: bifunctional precorrin-2 dehydrogenase/sirohydrochlorin ferrochelatase [Acidimicrobiales bacterium]|jgi:siroheme synthase-like protein|nr:bifunctional precorrin-2 dehydrogenase/sirohydrochlorin ferrochelatase [Acidimicrobiales bacterium]
MPVEEPLYPANLRLQGVVCLVVGGGPVALGKVRGLLEAHATVTVVAPDVVTELDELGASGDVAIERRRYEPGEAARYRLAVTATGDPAVDGAVYEDAEAAGVWVNAADDPAHCSFTVPARIRRGPLLVTFATGGQSPALAAWLRERFEEELGPEYEKLLTLLAEARADLTARGESTEHPGWKRALDSGMLEMIREGHLAEAKERLQACLSSSSD